MVTDNYQSFFVDFTNEQNQSNQGLCVKFNVSDSRNAYNTNAFFQFKDVYGDENCAFHCLIEAGLLCETLLDAITRPEKITITVQQFKYMLSKAFDDNYFSRRDARFQKLVIFF